MHVIGWLLYHVYKYFCSLFHARDELYLLFHVRECNDYACRILVRMLRFYGFCVVRVHFISFRMFTHCMHHTGSRSGRD